MAYGYGRCRKDLYYPLQQPLWTFWIRRHLTRRFTSSGPLYPPERLVSFLVTMRTSLISIRFHIRTWWNTCLRCWWQFFRDVYANLKNQGTISFWSTSFIRGTTFDNAILIIDEFQNLNFHELDSIITRVGENSKIHFCGDATQTDLVKTHERNGIVDFMRIINQMPSFDTIEFQPEDICRSGLVKEYIVLNMNWVYDF